MAITFDAVTTSAVASFSHTTTGDNRGLVLVVVNGGTDDVTATYNSVALTKRNTVVLPVAGDRMTLLTLDAPTSGSNTLAVTCTGFTEATVVSYAGVNTFTAGITGTNSGASITITNTQATDQKWVFSAAFGRTGPHALTASTGVTNDRTSGATYIGCGDSGPEGSGSINHTWNNGLSSDNAATTTAILPLSSSSAANLLLMGVGT